MLNPTYIAQLEQRISQITTCQELAQVSQEALEYFTSLESSLAGNLSTYAALIVPPTDLGSLITWANKVITMFTGPYNQIIAMQAQLIIVQASILALISSKMGTLSCQRILMSDLNTMMRIPRFGASINGLSVYGGG